MKKILKNNQSGIGIDMESTLRFKTAKKNDLLLKKIFSQAELDYCFKMKNPAQHLAARYAAKEASLKALGSMGITVTSLDYKKIEIKSKKSGAPFAVATRDLWSRPIAVSLSHAGDLAIAVAFIN